MARHRRNVRRAERRAVLRAIESELQGLNMTAEDLYGLLGDRLGKSTMTDLEKFTAHAGAFYRARNKALRSSGKSNIKDAQARVWETYPDAKGKKLLDLLGEYYKAEYRMNPTAKFSPVLQGAVKRASRAWWDAGVHRMGGRLRSVNKSGLDELAKRLCEGQNVEKLSPMHVRRYYRTRRAYDAADSLSNPLRRVVTDRVTTAFNAVNPNNIRRTPATGTMHRNHEWQVRAARAMGRNKWKEGVRRMRTGSRYLGRQKWKAGIRRMRGMPLTGV